MNSLSSTVVNAMWLIYGEKKVTQETNSSIVFSSEYLCP